MCVDDGSGSTGQDPTKALVDLCSLSLCSVIGGSEAAKVNSGDAVVWSGGGSL